MTRSPTMGRVLEKYWGVLEDREKRYALAKNDRHQLYANLVEKDEVEALPSDVRTSQADPLFPGHDLIPGWVTEIQGGLYLTAVPDGPSSPDPLRRWAARRLARG